METTKDEQEVTVEVVPQTVTEIIYLTEPDLIKTEPNYYIPSEEELEDEESESYEIGSVDPTRIQHMSLILDESQSFVLLSPPGDCFKVNVDLEAEKSDSSDDDTSDKEYKCEICNTKCHSKKTLSCHKLLHTDLGVLKPVQSECICKVCGLHFDKAQALSHHFRTCHEPPKLICNICGCPCAHDSALMAHYKKHEPKQFACDVCNSGYDNAVDLNNHKKTHNTNLLYACNKCDAEFASTAAVSTHLRYVHAKPRSVQNANNIPLVANNDKSYLCSTTSLNNAKVQINAVECKSCPNANEKEAEDRIDCAAQKSKRKKR